MNSFRFRRPVAAFTSLELIVGLLLFSAATGSILIVSKGQRDNSTAAASASQQNAYATFQSQVALQGIDPSLVGNPLQASIQQAGSVGTTVSLGSNTGLTAVNQVAGFEVGAVSSPTGATRNLAGSARVHAVNYSVAAAGAQSARGAGIGFAIEMAGAAPVINAIPLAPPSFNVPPILTGIIFPLNDVASLPNSNHPGTVYRYTLDGSTPTESSLIWDNNPGWTADTFPAQVTLRAFNTDPDYAPSVPVSIAFSMDILLNLPSRADGRSSSSTFQFTLTDLGSPAATGLVLSTNVPGAQILYSLDGSDPSQAGTVYTGPFAPTQAQFASPITLKFTATSTDPRYTAPTVPSSYPLSIATLPLQPPTFVTSNASPLAPGTPVVLSVSGSASPRTEVNNGSPSTGSSSAMQFPLN